MDALVVYESLFGNTRAVAEAVAEGIRQAGLKAEAVPVRDAGAAGLTGVELLVVGAPTHAFGLPRSATRQSGLQWHEKALQKGTAPSPVEPDAAGAGLREWFANLPIAHPWRVGAAFDTRMDQRITGGAARPLLRRLRRHHYRPLDAPRGFAVSGMGGPLAPGELDRARSWGVELAGLVPHRVP